MVVGFIVFWGNSVSFKFFSCLLCKAEYRKDFQSANASLLMLRDSCSRVKVCNQCLQLYNISIRNRRRRLIFFPRGGGGGGAIRI